MIYAQNMALWKSVILHFIRCNGSQETVSLMSSPSLHVVIKESNVCVSSWVDFLKEKYRKARMELLVSLSAGNQNQRWSSDEKSYRMWEICELVLGSIETESSHFVQTSENWNRAFCGMLNIWELTLDYFSDRKWTRRTEHFAICDLNPFSHCFLKFVGVT